MRLLLYTLICSMMVSCAGSPITTETKENNSSGFAAVMERPTENELIGIWEAEPICGELLEEKGYFNNSVSFSIDDETMFTFQSLPDMIWDPHGLPADTSLYSGYGSWTLKPSGKQWLVTLNPDSKEQISVLMYRDNGELLLYMPVGDLSTSEGILFRRADSPFLTEQ